MTCTLQEILKRREERQDKRRILLERYRGSLISFHLNIPGNIKDKLLYKVTLIDGFNSLVECLKKQDLVILFEAIEFHKTGPEAVCMVHHDPVILKKILVEFEEQHELGRLFDLDVYTPNGVIDRQSLGLKERRCYVCDEPAKVCARSKRHDIKKVIRHIEDMIERYQLAKSQIENSMKGEK